MKRNRDKRNIWFDLTTDHKTGHYIGKDIIKVVSFVFSLVLALLKVAAKWYSDKDLEITDLIALFLFTALGAQATKLADNFYRRRTKDGNGNELTIPEDETTGPPPYPLANPTDEKSTPDCHKPTPCD